MLRLKTRRFVFWSMVVLYFITATLVLLFGNGYRARLSPLRIARTGNILATYVPKDAVAQVDRTDTYTSSPARIRALFPGDHTLVISKNGFLPYIRSSHTEAQRTTFFTDIYLIRDSAPEKIGEAPRMTTSTPDNALPTVMSIAGQTYAVSTTSDTGTVLLENGTPATRDLGYGVWRIAGGDSNMIVLAKTDTRELYFHPRSALETSAFTVSGTGVVAHKFNGEDMLLAYSPFELWQISTKNGTATLVSRMSKPIAQVLPIPKTLLVALVLPDQIVVYQLGEQLSLPTVVAEAAAISDARVSDDGKSVEYTALESGAFIRYSRVLVE